MAYNKKLFFLMVASLAIAQMAMAGDPDILTDFVALEVGFVDTTNKFFTQTLQPGDLFVFPKGLVHFQYNADEKIPTLAISAFGSSNAGTVSLPDTLFNTSIDDNVLALSFKTDVATIQKLKAGLATKK
ncbi:germin-like protein 9-3 [Olea europaea var. sylvestris]|uniref:germin-like protein 9-3 n=1 Tax=Olea europaea var. sylvestris TaxID=158386 RepID=UPI000C1CE713|nr:germin-like protein 9-3 [Olea europaea var. sylvestris]